MLLKANKKSIIQSYILCVAVLWCDAASSSQNFPLFIPTEKTNKTIFTNPTFLVLFFYLFFSDNFIHSLFFIVPHTEYCIPVSI